jgi:benzoyl-CoA reductase subunit C
MTLEKYHVGFTCSMVPEELIFAAGLEPIRIFKIPKNKCYYSSNYFPSNFCSLVKGYLDILMDNRENQEDKLDGLILTPSCNATEFLFDTVKHEGVVDYLYMLDVPRKRDKEGVRFFAKQLSQLSSFLEDAFDTQISKESLLDTITLFNSIRENLNIIKKARLQGIISGRDFFSMIVMVATQNKKKALEKIIKVRESIKEKSIDFKKKKILVIGTPLLNLGLIDCIESAGGAVFLDDFCTSHTYLGNSVSTEGDLFLNMSSSYLQGRICTRMDCKLDRINKVKEMLDKFNPDGVIYNLSKFRVTDCYDSIALKEELFYENHPPFMVLENDNDDHMNLASTTRIEAFLELL